MINRKTFLIVVLLSCVLVVSAQRDVSSIVHDYWCPGSTKVLVAAHRSDWHAAPENSLPAMQACIDNGTDIVELDNKMTKDGVLVIMHDTRIDRTTNGTGNVSDYTLKELKKFRLKDADGNLTNVQIPTFEEAMMLCKGKVMVNIDQSYGYWDEVMRVLEKTGTKNQVIMKSSAPYSQLVAEHPNVFNEIAYMPVVTLSKPDAWKDVEPFIGKVRSVECCFDKDNPAVVRMLERINAAGVRVWINTMWASLCAGHDDQTAYKLDASERYTNTWDWLLEAGGTMLQTDHSGEMVEYLRVKGLH